MTDLAWREARISDKWQRYSAESPFGSYEALEWSNGGYGGTLAPAAPEARGIEFDAADIDHAKAICEADFRQRLSTDHLTTLEASLLTIHSSMIKYLKKEMTAEEFALEVIGAVDKKEVVRAVKEKKGNGR